MFQDNGPRVRDNIILQERKRKQRKSSGQVENQEIFEIQGDTSCRDFSSWFWRLERAR